MPTPAADPNVQVSTADLIGLRRRAEGLRLTAREPTRSVLAGGHRSPFRGRGMDYQESRHYQPGDDIRNMDWRITARAGRPHVKVYEEERERPVIVLVDLSPSMFFGTRGAFKSVAAARVAALVGWAAIARGDRIGALLFGSSLPVPASRNASPSPGTSSLAAPAFRDASPSLGVGGHHELQPAGGRRAVMRLIRNLALAGETRGGAGPHGNGRPAGRGQEPGRAGTQPQGGLSAALSRLRRVIRPGSLIFVVSDFHSMDGDSERHLGQLRRHSEAVACQISDALELAPPPPGRYGIGDGRQTGVLDTRPSAARERYADYFARHRAAVAAMTKAQGIPLLRLSPEDDPVARLTEGLELRLTGSRRHRRVAGPGVAA
jgi:uncharacterized protein (DUF58 family)